MRLIDADEFKEYIEDGIKIAFIQAPWEAKEVEMMADAIIKDIDEQPTVEALPVIHAKWERGYTFPDGAYWKCTNCGELIKVKVPMHYCSNCGAKMDGGEKPSLQR